MLRAVAGLILLCGAARAEPLDDAALLEAMFTAPGPKAEWFSEGFLRQVPLEQVQDLIKDLKARYGRPAKVEGGAGRFTVRTRSHRLPVLMERDPDGRIAGLLFRPAEALRVNIYKTLSELRRLPGEVAYLVRKGNGILAAHNAEAELAVGSAFKLAVVRALRKRIETTPLDWAEVIRLESPHFSLPSGFLQDLPPGSPLTLHSLAATMIALSDNTATDSLIAYLGRRAVEAETGLAPLLTTREVFQLKADPELYRDYEARDLRGRRQLLSEIADRDLPRPGQVTGPWLPEAEWRLSARRLCGLIAAVGDLDVMQINPGLADKTQWRGVAYKGGSETGVLNMTTLATNAAGVAHCVAVTWNDSKALDDARFSDLYREILLALRD